MSAPETLPLVLGLIGYCALIAVLAWIADRKVRRRNRWIDPPRPDDRNSIEQFKRMNRP